MLRVVTMKQVRQDEKTYFLQNSNFLQILFGLLQCLDTHIRMGHHSSLSIITGPVISNSPKLQYGESETYD